MVQGRMRTESAGLWWDFILRYTSHVSSPPLSVMVPLLFFSGHSNCRNSR